MSNKSQNPILKSQTSGTIVTMSGCKGRFGILSFKNWNLFVI